jgi:two-component system NtrC family sensor kinase
VLQKVSSEINATLDLAEILDIVLRTMGELFGFDHALVMLLDEDGETLRVAASRGFDKTGEGATVKLGVGVIGMVAKKRRIMRVNNLAQQRAYAAAIRKRMVAAGQAAQLSDAAELPGLPNADCQIAIPLLIRDNLIGVFSVEDAEQKTFNERDENLASIVANQAASAINNARMFQTEGERRRELAAAHEELKRLAESLEDRVRERTEELSNTNRELRDAQAQLVQSGKMASLGQLVAGVAHELNTPLGSIRSSADLAVSALAKVKNGLDKLGVDDRRLLRSITALERACEMELVASERAAGIVQSLRNFARLDEAEQKRVDIHEGLDSTLAMITHELKDIEVVRDYGEIGEVLCFPNQLNQVFMNILVNASHAMTPPGKITISTRRDGDDVEIRFADTGCGIAVDDLPRVFDPGFTKKGVGVGTGLGLSICFQIIEKHGGRITAQSTLGDGSTFTVRFPRSRARG